MRSFFLVFLLSTINYSCYTSHHKSPSSKEKNRSNSLVNFGINALSGSTAMAAYCSGAIVAGATQPLMVISTKLYADMDKKQYKNGLDAAYKTYSQGGLRGFYKGSGWRSVGIIASLATLDKAEEKLSALFNKK